jgi:Cu/Ag efflux pump CusA
LRVLEVGAILVVIVLFLFLFNFRTAAISFTAIPLSLLAAILVLERLGFSLNTMVLGGLAIAIGEVVDDAVIDVENIFRRLLENPRPVLRVALNAFLEVRRAVVFATLSVVLVFLPVSTLSGLAGRLFAPLAIAYILAVLASLLVALTVTPALCLLLLRRPPAEKEPPLVRWAKHGYENLLLRVFDVSVSLNPQERKIVSAVAKLPIRSPGGVYVRLQDLADIYETPGRSVVLHQGGRRVQVVTCNVSPGQVSAFAAEAKKRIFSTVSLRPGTYIEFSGSAEEQARSQRDLFMHSVLAATGIVLLLSVVLGDYRNVLLVLLNLPFALVGGVLAALFSGGLLSLGSMVGFVTVFGISLRNSIMMISHYEHLVLVEGVPWGPQVALRGAGERLAPILMTALVTGLGLLPLAIGIHQAGREIEGPMAIVILGGLVTSTALNLLVLPTLALKYGRFGRKMEEE